MHYYVIIIYLFFFFLEITVSYRVFFSVISYLRAMHRTWMGRGTITILITFCIWLCHNILSFSYFFFLSFSRCLHWIVTFSSFPILKLFFPTWKRWIAATARFFSWKIFQLFDGLIKQKTRVPKQALESLFRRYMTHILYKRKRNTLTYPLLIKAKLIKPVSKRLD